jgi:DNA polymerase IV
MRVAQRLKAAIREATGLTASAGVAPNKFLAKIASGWQKPDGLTVIAPERVEAFLQKLPVDALWGVGPVTARKLRAHGIERLVDVRLRSLDDLRPSSARRRVAAAARARHRRPAGGAEPPAQVGRQREHVPHDLTDEARDPEAVAEQAHDVAEWLVRKGVYGRTVTLKVRYGDFTTITRSHSEPHAVQRPGRDRRARRRPAREDRGGPAAGPPARRQRAQPAAHAGSTADRRQAAVRRRDRGRERGYDRRPTVSLAR